MIKVIIVDTEKLPVANSQNCSQVCTTTFCITPCWCGGQQSLLALGKPIEWLERPTEDDKTLWLFDGAVEGEKEKLIIIPIDKDGCLEATHWLYFAESWSVSVNGSWGATYIPYAKMEGKFCQIYLPQFIQESET